PYPFRYSIVDLGTFGGTITRAYSINTLGNVVGYSTLPSGVGCYERPFYYHGGIVEDLENKVHLCISAAFAINDHGVMVIGVTNGGTMHLWDGATLRDLGMLPGDISSWGLGINNSGHVAGYSTLSCSVNCVTHAVWFDGATLRSIGNLGGTRNDALAI